VGTLSHIGTTLLLLPCNQLPGSCGKKVAQKQVTEFGHHPFNAAFYPTQITFD
jgi:hypothetical protein